MRPSSSLVTNLHEWQDQAADPPNHPLVGLTCSRMECGRRRRSRKCINRGIEIERERGKPFIIGWIMYWRSCATKILILILTCFRHVHKQSTQEVLLLVYLGKKDWSIHWLRFLIQPLYWRECMKRNTNVVGMKVTTWIPQPLSMWMIALRPGATETLAPLTIL